jgi:hypothetical protein
MAALALPRGPAKSNVKRYRNMITITANGEIDES